MRTKILVPVLVGAAGLFVIVGLIRSERDTTAAAVREVAAAPPRAGATSPAKETGTRKVAIVLYDGVELLDFAGPAEVLQVAGGFANQNGSRGLDVYTVGRTTSPIVAQGFVHVSPQYAIDDAPRPDLIVIPGGSSRALSDDPVMMRWLTKTIGAADATLTVCTGAFPLARAGLLDGLEATTWYGAVSRLQAIAPKAHVTPGRRFVDNGKIVTTAGVSAGIDGALHLVARFLGRRVADQTARYMEYHWTPEPYLEKHYSYWNPSTNDRGRAIQRAEQAMEEQHWSEATAAYRKLTAGDTNGTAWVGLGNALFRQDDMPGAADAYRKVTPSSAAYARARYNLACALARSGKKDAALAAVSAALAAGASRGQALADPDLASIRDRISALTTARK